MLERTEFEQAIRDAVVTAYEQGFTDGANAVREVTVPLPEDWIERAHKLAFDEEQA